MFESRCLFSVPAALFINKNARIPTLKAQFHGIDRILAGTGGKKPKPKSSTARCQSPCRCTWFGVYLENINIHWVCQKVFRLENLFIKLGLCFEEMYTGTWFSRCNSVALLLKHKQAQQFKWRLRTLHKSTSFYGAWILVICRVYHLGLCPGNKGPRFMKYFSWNKSTMQAVRVKLRTRHFFNSDFSVICFVWGEPGCFCANWDSHCQTVCFKLFLKMLGFEGS